MCVMNQLKATLLNAFDKILPTSVKNSLLHLSFNLARAEFDRFSHLYGFAPNMEMGLTSIALRGLQPVTVIDVGAFEGDWSRMAHRIWPRSRIIMFEPNLEKSEHVLRVAQAIDAKHFCHLLGASDGTKVTFNVMGSG